MKKGRTNIRFDLTSPQGTMGNVRQMLSPSTENRGRAGWSMVSRRTRILLEDGTYQDDAIRYLWMPYHPLTLFYLPDQGVPSTTIDLYDVETDAPVDVSTIDLTTRRQKFVQEDNQWLRSPNLSVSTKYDIDWSTTFFRGKYMPDLEFRLIWEEPQGRPYWQSDESVLVFICPSW